MYTEELPRAGELAVAAGYLKHFEISVPRTDETILLLFRQKMVENIGKAGRLNTVKQLLHLGVTEPEAQWLIEQARMGAASQATLILGANANTRDCDPNCDIELGCNVCNPGESDAN